MNANKAITYSNKLCLHKVAMRVTSLSYEQFLCEALQVQKYFMSVKLFFWGCFSDFQLKKCVQMMCFATEGLKIKFKMGSLPRCLLRVDIALVHPMS